MKTIRGFLIGLGVAYLLGSEQTARLRRDISRMARGLTRRGREGLASLKDEQWESMATVVIDVNAAREQAQPSHLATPR